MTALLTFESCALIEIGCQEEWSVRVTGRLIEQFATGARLKLGMLSFAIESLEVRRPGDAFKEWHLLPVWLLTDRQMLALGEEAIAAHEARERRGRMSA